MVNLSYNEGLNTSLNSCLQDMDQPPVVRLALLPMRNVGAIAMPTPNAANSLALLVKSVHSMCAVASLGFVE